MPASERFLPNTISRTLSETSKLSTRASETKRTSRGRLLKIIKEVRLALHHSGTNFPNGDPFCFGHGRSLHTHMLVVETRHRSGHLQV